MYYVYLLTDQSGKIYIGFTKDLKRRIEEHKRGKTYWTKRLVDLHLLYYEAYSSRELALEREKKLKIRGSAYQGLIKRIGLK